MEYKKVNHEGHFGESWTRRGAGEEEEEEQERKEFWRAGW